MNSMLRRRYSLYVASSSGTEAVLKSSNGMKNITAEQSSVTRSCSRKKSTYPLKLSNNAKKSRYLVSVSPRGLLWPCVVPSDALEREVEPVRDLLQAPARLVDGPLALNLVPREDHHPADRVGDGHERFVLLLGIQLRMRLRESPPGERRDDRVAGQEKFLAQFGAVIQVGFMSRPRVVQVEARATGQRPCSTGACGNGEESDCARQDPSSGSPACPS